MKRTLLIISLALTTLTLSATRRALVVGIGNYPASSGWAKINGDKDIPMVEEMLLANGFSKANIVELSNQQATCAAIKQQFENLIARSQSGDYIYIHFSGHGQQITDLNGDEEDGFDEAWIPYDAQFAFTKGKYEGQNHLIDDELNGYLHRLREKIGGTGKIIVVADACHSGGGSRAETDEEYVVRGTADAFVIKGVKKTVTAVSYPVEWTFISACKPYQCNYEYKGNGSLTYALYQQKDNFTSLTSKQVGQRVRSCIASIIPFTQTPVLEVTSGTETDIFF
ncbi:MAG: caspase family protein [Paludibacteraceae bacterium]|nr:caspase family protein [Paludibacteraceae bacterium]